MWSPERRPSDQRSCAQPVRTSVEVGIGQHLTCSGVNGGGFVRCVLSVESGIHAGFLFATLRALETMILIILSH